MVDQIADLFRTTHKVKTQQVVKSRGHHCGDVGLTGYLANTAGPVSLLLSGVQLAQTDRDQFHFRRAAFTQQLKSRVDLTLDKETALRITLNLDGTSIISTSHTHPSHSQTSRLLTSSLSLDLSLALALLIHNKQVCLESQKEDAPKRVLFFKPMSWLGQIRPHRRDESWSASL
jgi:hypothetical protein